MLVERGADNLTATFSPALVNAQTFVLDVAGGGDVARKGGPGISGADLLVINKIDLGKHVDVDVDEMVADAGPRCGPARTAARRRAPLRSDLKSLSWRQAASPQARDDRE